MPAMVRLALPTVLHLLPSLPIWTLLVLAELNRRRGGAPPRTQLRTRLIEPFGQRSLRVTHSFGLGADTDDRLVLDRQRLGPGEAFRARDTRLRSFPLSASDQPLDLMTKYERALTRR